MCTFIFSRGSLANRASRRTARAGFSAIEGLMVIGLISVMAGLSVPLYRTFQIRNDLNLATEHIVQSLSRAQTLAQSGQDDASWGVYVQEGTLFAGQTYVLRNPEKDETLEIPSTIDATGLPEVVYTRLDGIPVETGSIILTALNGEYREILIGNGGRIAVGELQSPAVLPGGSEGGDGGENGQDSGAGEDGDNGSDGENGTDGDTGENGDDGGDADTGGGSSSSSASGTDTAGDTGNEDGGDESGDDGGGDDDEDPGECEATFSLNGERVETVGTVDLTLKVLGSEITYGENGPAVSVTVSSSVDNAQTWTSLFGGNPVSAGNTVTFANLPDGTPLALRFNGRYSWLFNKTYDSNDSDGHVIILKNGDKAPNYKSFGNQSSLASFLRSIIDDKGRIKIGEKDLVFLVELGTLNTNSSDFQDAVVLATFTPKPLTCSPDTEPRVKISFNRLENSGNGDVQNKVFVGPQGTAFAEEQWIPLTSNGQVIVDNGLKETVKGLAFERGPGWIRILNHGSHDSNNSKEIVDARVLFNKAYITSVVNDEGQNKSENPNDGVTNDGSEGDEFVGGPNEKSMTFSTRVTSSDDAVILYWTTGNPPNNGNQSSSSSSSSASSEDEEEDEDEDEEEAAIDPCAVPFTVQSDGRVTLGGKADVTVRVAGSESTYGHRGPRVQVRSQIRIGNAAFQPLFGYRAMKGGELVTFSDQPAGSDIVLEFSGRYTWLFRNTVRSGESDDHVRVLEKGDYPPTTPLITQRTTLKSFFRNLLGTDGKINVTGRQVAYLVELGDLSETADYQDAVIILSVDKPASEGSCGSQGGSSSSTSSSSSASSQSSSSSSSSSSVTPQDPRGDQDGDGVRNSDDICTGTYMPESVPTEEMLFDRYALTSRSAIFRVGPRKKVSQYTLEDTRGCSCGQILDAIEGKNTYRFEEYPTLFRRMRSLFSFYVKSSRQFGCGESLMEMVSDGR